MQLFVINNYFLCEWAVLFILYGLKIFLNVFYHLKYTNNCRSSWNSKKTTADNQFSWNNPGFIHKLLYPALFLYTFLISHVIIVPEYCLPNQYERMFSFLWLKIIGSVIDLFDICLNIKQLRSLIILTVFSIEYAPQNFFSAHSFFLIILPLISD